MNKSKRDKLATVQFQCDPAWKRRFAAAVAGQGKTYQAVCVEVLSRHLKISTKEEAA